MPSVKAFYLIDNYSDHEDNDGRYYVDLEFALAYDLEFNDAGAPSRFKARFYDHKRAHALVKHTGRVLLIITERENEQVVTLAATLGELEPFMRPASLSLPSSDTAV
jgi:hypothetical protein